MAIGPADHLPARPRLLPWSASGGGAGGLPGDETRVLAARTHEMQGWASEWITAWRGGEGLGHTVSVTEPRDRASSSTSTGDAMPKEIQLNYNKAVKQKRNRVRLVSYLGPRGKLEAHLGCFGITKYSVVHIIVKSVPFYQSRITFSLSNVNESNAGTNEQSFYVLTPSRRRRSNGHPRSVFHSSTA